MLEESGRIGKTEKAIDTALIFVKDKITEEEFAWKCLGTIIEEGGLPLFNAIGFGHRSAYPNVEPSQKKLQKGDIIRFDGGCTWNSYSSDLT